MELIPTKFADLVSASQGFVVSLAFLYITWKLPSAWIAFLSSKKDLAVIESQREASQAAAAALERKEDREARHETTSRFQAVMFQLIESHDKEVKEIGNTLTELRIVTQNLCRFQHEQSARGGRHSLPAASKQPPQSPTA